MPSIQIWIDDIIYARLLEATRGVPKQGREKPLNTYIRDAIVDRLNRDKVIVPSKATVAKATE